MGIFGKKKEAVPQEDTVFIDYVIRKICGCKTYEEISAKKQSLRASMTADEQRRLHEEKQNQERAALKLKLAEERRELALKSLGRIKVYLRPTARELGGTSQFVSIGPDMTVKCPECGNLVDVSEQVMILAERIRDKSEFIDRALADPMDARSASIFENSCLMVGHNKIYNGRQCSTIIEVVIDGCRILGDLPERIKRQM